MITIRQEEYREPNLRLRVEDARHHIRTHGRFHGETVRAAVVALAALTYQEEEIADVAGLLPADPV